MQIEEPAVAGAGVNTEEPAPSSSKTIWKCKGVQHSVNQFQKSQYHAAIFQERTTLAENRGMKLDKHKSNRMHTYKVQKKAVTFSYWKRHLRENRHETDALTYFDEAIDDETPHPPPTKIAKKN